MTKQVLIFLLHIRQQRASQEHENRSQHQIHHTTKIYQTPFTMDAYKYEPLDPTGTEIRLIKLEPSQQFSAQIRCSIFRARLEDAPTYNALSYVWGDQSNPICIKLNGCLFPVGINLYLALRRLRSLAKDVPAVYWVDAICINQKDDEERGHQVSMMRNIFEGANEVSVWLGEAAEGSALAMGLIRLWSTETLAEDWKRHFLKEPGLSDKRSWEATIKLLRRAWWGRVWVYQEFVVSRNALFVCGEDILDCHQLTMAIYNWLCLSTLETLHLFGNLVYSLILRRQSVETGSMFLHRQWKRIGNKDLKDYSLISLVFTTRNKLATDPRDKIYALLGVDEVGDIAVMPDYTISTSTVYQNFTVNCIKALDDLSIICLSGIETVGLKELSDSPSWIPDFSEASRLGEINVGMLETNPFIASKAYRPLYNFSLGNQILKARGLVCDTVTDCRLSEGSAEAASWESKIMCWSELALSLVGTPHPTGTSQYQAFFRTIIEDDSGYSDGRPLTHNHLPLDVPQDFVTRLMGFFLAMGELGKNVNPRERAPAIQHKLELWNKIHEQNSHWARGFALWRGALDEPIISNIPSSDEVLVAPFLSVSGSISPLELREVLAAIDEDAYAFALDFFLTTFNALRKNRCFFVSSKGYMGLGPVGTQVGDEICVLLGCNQPLLIRRLGDHHVIVGQCYVYGMMFGEMMDEMEAGRLVAEDFYFK